MWERGETMRTKKNLTLKYRKKRRKKKQATTNVSTISNKTLFLNKKPLLKNWGRGG